MSAIEPLAPDRLCRQCEDQGLSFESTAELEPLAEIVGQDRAVEAMRFGIGMRHHGYNLFLVGPPGIGKQTVAEKYLRQRADTQAPALDWCHVNDFAQDTRPRALGLPAGWGSRLKMDMQRLVEDLRVAIPSAFETDEYRARAQEIEAELKERQAAGIRAITEEAQKHGISLLRTPSGFAFAPTRNGEVIGPEEFAKLPQEERERTEAVVSGLQQDLQKVLAQVPGWRRENREKLKALNREVTMFAVGHLMEQLRSDYAELTVVLEYLAAVQQDVIDNVDAFRRPDEAGGPATGGGAPPEALRRYSVNLLVDHAGSTGVPVVYEDNPNFQNLIGRVEYLSHMGALLTDFTLIKPGALHRANGGYLMLDARKLLSHPYAWEGLKRALQAEEICVESLGQALSLISTASLEPEPIPLRVKVVLLGERLLYYLLQRLDPDFGELFKVGVDFDDRMPRTESAGMQLARLVAGVTRRHGSRPLARAAVGRVIEHSARYAGDAERLSTHMRGLEDLVIEADYWAGAAGRSVVVRADVQQAIDAQVRRRDRVRERIFEEIGRGTLLIDTEGERIAQVNGLAVIQLGDFAFAQPVRITATVRLGEGQIVNVEREAELSGAVHSKGVMILSAFLSAHYARNQPLSVSASLAIEQSYGMVDGDSASLAELCALLSALAEAPVRQSLAVTGSVNQLGQVQAIGGVDEKVEGFFDICAARGLTGEQGVLIPAANVKHLMLKQEVVEAARDGRFHVYPVERVNQALEVLTGLLAGERDAEDGFPEDSVNYRVEVRLGELAVIRQTFAEVVKEMSAHQSGGCG